MKILYFIIISIYDTTEYVAVIAENKEEAEELILDKVKKNYYIKYNELKNIDVFDDFRFYSYFDVSEIMTIQEFEQKLNKLI